MNKWCTQHGYPLPCDKCGYEAGFKAGERAQRDKQSVVGTEAYFRGRADGLTQQKKGVK